LFYGDGSVECDSVDSKYILAKTHYVDVLDKDPKIFSKRLKFKQTGVDLDSKKLYYEQDVSF